MAALQQIEGVALVPIQIVQSQSAIDKWLVMPFMPFHMRLTWGLSQTIGNDDFLFFGNNLYDGGKSGSSQIIPLSRHCLLSLANGVGALLFTVPFLSVVQNLLKM